MKNFEAILLGVSIVTSLLTEAIKKLQDESKANKPNITAAIVSMIVSAFSVVGYVVYFGIAVTPQIIVIGVSLMILSFLCATVGYDKVKQTIAQIVGK